MKNYIVIIAILLGTGFYSKAQLPGTDKNWKKVFYDGFNYGSWSNFKLIARNPTAPIWHTGLWGTSIGDTSFQTEYSSDNDGGHNFNFDSITAEGDTIMSLVCRKESPQFSGYYTDSTGNHSRSYNFTHTNMSTLGLEEWQYGYFEVRMRLMDLTKTRTGSGGSAWLFEGHKGASCKSEIDLYECNSEIHGQTTHTCDVHYAPFCSTCGSSDGCGFYEYAIQQNYGADQTPMDFSSHQFHVVSAEWTPDHVDFYIDGVFLKSVTKSSFNDVDKLSQMALILGTGAQPYTHYPLQSAQVTDSTVFPYYHDLDYVKVWKLDMDSCSSGTTTLNNFDATTYPYGVKHALRITGNAASTISSGQKVTLRASNGIEIDKNFSVAKGAEFTMLPTPCQ